MTNDKDNMIDHTVLDIYTDEGLWKKEGFWYALLEQYFYQQFVYGMDVGLSRRIIVLAKKRQQYILDTTYAKSGQINVYYKNPIRRVIAWALKRITKTTI